MRRRIPSMAASSRAPDSRTVAAWSACTLLSVLLGCGSSSNEPAARSLQTHSIASILKATPNPLMPEQVAEAFALGSDFTDLQRDLIKKDLVGNVVEWDIQVYEVSYADGLYKVTSQELPITSTDAIPLIRVVAIVQAQDERDNQLLRSIKTNDALRIRGVAQDIVLRTIVTIAPAVIAPRR